MMHGKLCVTKQLQPKVMRERSTTQIWADEIGFGPRIKEEQGCLVTYAPCPHQLCFLSGRFLIDHIQHGKWLLSFRVLLITMLCLLPMRTILSNVPPLCIQNICGHSTKSFSLRETCKLNRSCCIASLPRTQPSLC